MNSAKTSVKRAISAPPMKRNALTANKVTQMDSTSRSGGADEELFMNEFEDVPRVMIFSSKDLDREINKIRETCADPSIQWEKRVEALKRLRSLLIAGAADFDEFNGYLKPLELAFQVSVKDLRSKVVREASITIAYMSQRLGIRCDRFVEALLPTLINLIQNSAKIMSSSAVVAIRFIIQSTHASRLIPVITYNISSKSKEIRKSCCEFLDQMFHTWPNQSLEKHVAILSEAIKKGICDADPEARTYARKAYWGFADKFKKEANYLMTSLDSSKQRILHGEHNNISNWSSTHSLTKAAPQRPQSIRTTSVSSSGSIENLSRQNTLTKGRSGIPIFSPRNDPSARVMPSPFRTTSAIDPGAQRRAKARAAYCAALAQPKGVPSGYTASRTTPKRVDPTPERSRTKARVSKSQPGSRSASPSRFNFGSIQTDSRGHRVRRQSGIPTASSRDPSPNRAVITGYASMERRLSASGRNRNFIANNSNTNERQTPLMAEKILQQSQEAEAALQDALIADAQAMSARKRYNNQYDDHSDESETSSICSDISFSSYGRRKIEDVSDIIENLSSTHWSDRKEGLQSLAHLFRDSTRMLNSYELIRITDIFTKMLLDPHTKTFTLFLGILNDLILIYKHELNSWLYILITRLMLKIGSDTLGSIQSRILKTFDLIRESFSPEDQFVVIIRFLSDQTQTPNVRVKTSILQYLLHLIPLMDSNDINFNSRNNHEIQLSLMKIISWTADPKSSELRRISQDVIVDLYNLNAADMSLIINALPKTYEDAALQIIYHKRRSRSQSPAFSPLTPVSLRTPSVIKTSQAFNKLSLYDETENLNPDDIYNSLRKTTDEIQKYSFNVDSDSITTITNTSTNNHNISDDKQTLSPTISPKKTVLGRNIKDLSSASQDSGISQLDGTSIGQNNRQTPVTSPLKPSANETIIPIVFSQNGNHSYIENENSAYFNTVLIGLRSNTKDTESQKESLNDLIELIREGSNEEWAQRFKEVYRILLDKMTEQSNSAIRAMSLRVMCELLMKRTKYFPEFIELTILRILESSKDPEKEVVRAAEGAAGTASAVLPPEQCLKILKSVIKTGENPVNIAAIKMLTKLIELQPKHIVMDLLPQMMPALLQAYDNPESAVRKAAVFCMVSIHSVVADAINPYLSSLNGSKMKLLKLYIERAKSQSGNSSPLLAATS
ncbi:unnamed protein product [Medioppia subpectinata]|uniref:TOG domain-containing protein n=1 Tax=Medioppia subpectinata TaxID=1979941 RepID=A0A7R9KFE4_9ACAR|nr:unnamed protein product [Medioppia subpectinata]CAG2101182.1 unnamed protein product [Medioppia subpectinata]